MIRLDTHNEGRETDRAVAAIRAELDRPAPAMPEAELSVLHNAAAGNTGQSRTCRYLLFLLVGAAEPSGFTGEGLLEIRTLDTKLSNAFLEVLKWWRGPTKTDAPIYDILRDLENQSKPAL